MLPKANSLAFLEEMARARARCLRTIGGVYAPDSGVVIVNGDMSALYELGITGNDHLTGQGFRQSLVRCLLVTPGETTRS